MTRPVSTALGLLGARLRGLREQTAKTGTEFAAGLGDGWGQSKVSKIETGRQLPSEADLVAWASAADADPGPLVALRAQAATDYRSHKDRNRRAGGVVEHQADLTTLAESCTFLAEFQPAVVPGRLQTAAYMREIDATSHFLADDGVPAETHRRVIASKVRRQAILYEPDREFVHVVTEAALRLRIGAVTNTTLRGQLVHLAELVTLPGHTFGVLPFTVPCPAMPSGFALYDHALVRVETTAGVLQLTDPDVVARHSRWLDQLTDVALTGEAAVGFCREVAASLPE